MTDLQIVNPTVETLTQHKLPFLVNLYNNLADKLEGVPHIKSWKDAKAKLAAKIIKLHEQHKAQVTQKADPAPAEGAYDKKRNAPKQPKATKAAKPAKQSKEKAPVKATAGDSELLAYIKEKGFTPKTARNRFRQHKVSKVEGRYVLNAETKKALA